MNYLTIFDWIDVAEMCNTYELYILLTLCKTTHNLSKDGRFWMRLVHHNGHVCEYIDPSKVNWFHVYINQKRLSSYDFLSGYVNASSFTSPDPIINCVPYEDGEIGCIALNMASLECLLFKPIPKDTSKKNFYDMNSGLVRAFKGKHCTYIKSPNIRENKNLQLKCRYAIPPYINQNDHVFFAKYMLSKISPFTLYQWTIDALHQFSITSSQIKFFDNLNAAFNGNINVISCTMIQNMVQLSLLSESVEIQIYSTLSQLCDASDPVINTFHFADTVEKQTEDYFTKILSVYLKPSSAKIFTPNNHHFQYWHNDTLQFDTYLNSNQTKSGKYIINACRNPKNIHDNKIICKGEKFYFIHLHSSDYILLEW